MRGIERGVDLSKVPDMRPMQDCGSKLDRLDGILAAMARERAADEDDRSEPIDQAKLPQRIDDINVGVTVGQAPLRASRRREACRARDLGDPRPAIRMARRNEGEELRKGI